MTDCLHIGWHCEKMLIALKESEGGHLSREIYGSEEGKKGTRAFRQKRGRSSFPNDDRRVDIAV